MKKDLRTIEERADDLEKVVTFNIITSIRRNYESLDDFKKIYSKIVEGNAGSHEQVKFCSIFGFGTKKSVYRLILGSIVVDGRRHHVSLKDVKPYFSKWFHYRRHFNKNYVKTGKTFSVKGYFYIDFEVLRRWYDWDGILDLNSDFYNHRQHVMINVLVLNSFTNKDGIKMTKKQEEQYIEEWKRGEHMLTLEQYKKEEAKKRRRDDKRRMTIAKKAAKATLTEFAQVQTKANMLEAMNAEKDERIAELERQLAELRKSAQDSKPTSDAHPYDDELNMKSEVPEYWNNYEKEGPRYRTDGTPLHRKCLPGLWMTPEQYKEFLEKKDEPYWCFEDDFENMWTGYYMTADEATA